MIQTATVGAAALPPKAAPVPIINADKFLKQAYRVYDGHLHENLNKSIPNFFDFLKFAAPKYPWVLQTL
jgi:hypothetical protein